MMKNELTIKNYLALDGNIVYLKRLGSEYTDDYWNSLKTSSIESTIFTVTTQVFSRDSIEAYISDIVSDNTRVDFLIFSKATNEILGEVVINDIYRNDRSSNIRIAINNTDDFGKGYGSEALKLALYYAFGMLNLHRIELEVVSFNKRAFRVYEKIGFIKEGIKRDGCYFNHQYYDLIIMSILEDEFRNRYLGNLDKLEAVIDED